MRNIRSGCGGRARLLAIVLLMGSAATAVAGSHARRAEGTVVVEDGTAIHYRDSGPAPGEGSLLFVPGWGMDGSIFDAQAKAFSSTRRVVVVDPRSQGRSGKPLQGNTPEVRARDLRSVVQALDLHDVVLVGWSQGVQDVAAYIAQFGDAHIAGVVLVDSALAAGAAGVSDQPGAARQLLERLSLYGEHPEAYLHGMMQAIFARPLPRDEEDRQVAIALQTPVSTGTAMLIADLLGKDRRSALNHLAKPLLVVASASSPELEAQRAMAASATNARFIAIEGAGHVVFVDQPQAFNATLEDFLRRVDGGGAQ